MEALFPDYRGEAHREVKNWKMIKLVALCSQLIPLYETNLFDGKTDNDRRLLSFLFRKKKKKKEKKETNIEYEENVNPCH